MPRVHLNIGSNLGDRRANISRAVELIRQLALSLTPEPNIRVSTPVESEPWGFDSANSFINIGISFDTDCPADELLRHTQRIERSISHASHRNPDGTYADRLIDIDIIAYGQLRCDTPELTLPHPRAALRPFVMQPLREIDPELIDIFVG